MDFCERCHQERDVDCDYCGEPYCSDCERSQHENCKYNHPNLMDEEYASYPDEEQ